MTRFSTAILLCFLFCSCKYEVAPQSVGNFPPNVSVILQNNCMGGGCHSGATDLNEGVDLTSWETLMKGGNEVNEIIPYTAEFSHLFGHINNNSAIAPIIVPYMPPVSYLSPADQLTIFNWINQGAKSNDGKIPYSLIDQKIFIVNKNANMISVLDASTQRWSRIITTGDQTAPGALAMMPDNKTFIAAMTNGNGVMQKYDASAYAPLGAFAPNIITGEIAITPDGSKGYATDDVNDGHKFIVFDPVAMKLSKTVSSSFLINPYSAVVSPDGKYAYICGAGSDNVIRIDTKNDSILKSMPMGKDVEVPPSSSYGRRYLPRKILLSADSKKMYVSCYNSNEIVVFDLTKDSIISRIPIVHNPSGMALKPDGSELWTVLYGDSAVDVINTSTNQVVARINGVSLYPNSISITPDGNYAYISCDLSAGGAHHHATGGLPSSSYVVIDCRTREIISVDDLPPLSVAVTMGFK